MTMSPARRRRWLARTALALTLGPSAGCRDATAPLEQMLTLQVAAARVSCTGAFPTTCLQTRERSDAPWQLFYDPIAGFTHEPGYQYVLRVARRNVPNPPADGSSVAYRLVAVLSRVATP